MTAVIHARYSSDNQREDLLKANSGNARHSQKRMASQFCGTTSTAPFLPRPTIALNFRT